MVPSNPLFAITTMDVGFPDAVPHASIFRTYRMRVRVPLD